MAKKSSAEKELEKNSESHSKKDKSDSPKNSKDLKQSFDSFKQFAKDSFGELKKVQWPTRRQAVSETVVVLVTVIFLTLLVLLFDNILAWLFGLIFQKS